MSARRARTVLALLACLLGAACADSGTTPEPPAGATSSAPASTLAPAGAHPPVRVERGTSLQLPPPPTRLSLRPPGLAEASVLAAALGLGPAREAEGAFLAESGDGRRLRVLAEPGGGWELTGPSPGGGAVAGCPPCQGPDPCAPCPNPPPAAGTGTLDPTAKVRAENAGRRVAAATGLQPGIVTAGSTAGGAVVDTGLALDGARVYGSPVRLVLSPANAPLSGTGPLVLTASAEPEEAIDAAGAVARLAAGSWVSCRHPRGSACPPDPAVVRSAVPAYVLAVGVPFLQPAAELLLDDGFAVVVLTRR